MSSAPKGMVFLEPEHPIIRNLVYENINNYINETGKRALMPMNVKVADFDGVTYQVVVDKSSTDKMAISMFMKGYDTISKAGSANFVKSLYGNYIKASPDNRADITLEINAATIAAPNLDSIADLFGLLKRNVLAGPFKSAFEALLSGSANSVKPSVFQIRTKEQMIISPGSDRIDVVLSFDMIETTDAVLCEQMLDTIANRSKSGNGPNIKFTKDVPGDVSRISGINPVNVGYLLITITKPHVTGNNMDNVIDLILTLRHYVHYHIKASKAHLHQRMRAKVKYFLQVLNRARPNATFTQKKAFRIIQK